MTGMHVVHACVLQQVYDPERWLEDSYKADEAANSTSLRVEAASGSAASAPLDKLTAPALTSTNARPFATRHGHAGVPPNKAIMPFRYAAQLASGPRA